MYSVYGLIEAPDSRLRDYYISCAKIRSPEGYDKDLQLIS